MTATFQLPLEDFAEALSPDKAGVRTPSKDYLKGFDDGVIAGQKAAEAHQFALREGLVSRLEDIAFSHAEARQHVLASIQPVIDQLCALVVPTLLSATFAARLSSQIADALREATDGKLSLHVAPSQRDAVEDLVRATEAAGVTVQEDPLLSPDQARFSGWESETLLDLPALRDALQTALAGLELTERTADHG